MSQEFSRSFYNSQAWRNARNAYKKSKGGLCEDCLKKGLINPGAEVHHIQELTPDNINDPVVALGFSNLCLLCRDCHKARHNPRRYTIDPITGRISV